jgi:hypothetical protein
MHLQGDPPDPTAEAQYARSYRDEIQYVHFSSLPQQQLETRLTTCSKVGLLQGSRFSLHAGFRTARH